MKQLRNVGAALVALVIAGCGGGDGENSPDFTPEVTSITISPSTATIAEGQTQQFTATATQTTPAGGFETVPIPSSNVTFTVPASQSVANITPAGLATGVNQGQVIITATSGSRTDTAVLTVGAGSLQEIIVDPASASLPVGGGRTFTARGSFTDGGPPRVIDDVEITWSANPANVVTLSSTTGSSINVTGAAIGQTVLTARATSRPNVNPGVSNITVTNAPFNGITRVEAVDANPATGVGGTDRIPVGGFTEYRAIGQFGTSTASIPDDQVNWTTSNPNIATVDPTGIIQGRGIGTATITAALRNTANTTGPTSASKGVTVTDAICTRALIDDGVGPTPTIRTVRSGSCTELNCFDVDIFSNPIRRPRNVIDTNPLNFADLIIGLDLLAPGSIGYRVSAGEIITPVAGRRDVGFIIGRPAGQLNLELLSSITVQTLNNDVPVEGNSAVNPLRLTLGGQTLIDPGDPTGPVASIGLVSFEATQPFDQLQVSLDSNVLTLASRIFVFAACGEADSTP